MKHLLPAKLIAIVLIICGLAFGLATIGDIVTERTSRQREAELSVENGQAGRQTLMGPLLQRYCIEEWDAWDGAGKARKLTVSKRDFTLTAIPERLQIDAGVGLDTRHRGIFQVNTYLSKTHLQAVWPSLSTLEPEREHERSRLRCGSPTLIVALSDARGIRSAQVVVDGKPEALRPGTRHHAYPRGFHVPLPDTVAATSKGFTADIDLELLGTGELSFVPVAGTTQVHVKSDWPHPSFGGRFLPVSREIRDNGFEATWRVSSLATTAPADFRDGVPLCANMVGQGRSGPDETCVESFGMAFFDPVNPYVLSDRAIKYGMLFVALTFVAVAMMEILKRRRVHPVQYLLVGSALSIFFLLLLSLSEHLPFGWAYALASSACSVLLTIYASYVMGGWRAGLAFGVGVGGLYGALFVLLQREQTALVMGSLLLFAVLAAVMLVTRKLDWYGVISNFKPEPKAARTEQV